MGIFSGNQAIDQTLPQRSALANLLRVASVVSVLVAGSCVWLLWSWSKTAAIWLGLVVVFFTPILVAVEVAALYGVNRGRHATRVQQLAGLPAPPLAGVAELIGVWWVESITSMRVFGHWQANLWRSEPDVMPPDSEGRTGVVFVHGFFCNRGLWLSHLREMRRLGVPSIAVNLEPVFGSIDSYVGVIEAAVVRITALTGRAPVLVGHSMGGLASRAWLRTTDISRVKRVITIGTPHHGTWTAQWSHARNGQQMSLGSAWLQQLAQDEAPDASERYAMFHCLHSGADNIVFPAGSATLSHARNEHIAAVGHVELAYVEPTMRAIVQAVSQDASRE